MRPKYIDAHTHVHFAAYKEDSDAVIKRALADGVSMITVGTERNTSSGAVETANGYDGVYAAIGLHPIHTSRSFHDAAEFGPGQEEDDGEEFNYDYYLDLGRAPKTVAVGECGLDYFHLEAGPEREAKIIKQKNAFDAQIGLAHELRKPLMIHCRDAFPDLIDLLSARSSLLLDNPGVIHFFTGTPEDAKRLMGLGFAFTFGGVVTFTRAYDEILNILPPSRILSETDAPYVAPVPYRGRRNEPAYVIETVKKLAEIKNIPMEEMAKNILQNAARIFGIK